MCAIKFKKETVQVGQVLEEDIEFYNYWGALRLSKGTPGVDNNKLENILSDSKSVSDGTQVWFNSQPTTEIVYNDTVKPSQMRIHCEAWRIFNDETNFSLKVGDTINFFSGYKIVSGINDATANYLGDGKKVSIMLEGASEVMVASASILLSYSLLA